MSVDHTVEVCLCLLQAILWPVNQVKHTNWVAIVTPTDRPKSVRNRCVIVVLSFCPFDLFVGIGSFVIGLVQISSFFSY